MMLLLVLKELREDNIHVREMTNYMGKKIKEQTLNQQKIAIKLPASKGMYIIQVSDEDARNKVRKKLLIH